MGEKEHSNHQVKEKAIKMYNDGENIARLSEIFGVAERTIYRWVERYRSSGDTELKGRDGRGRPPKITPAKAKRLLRMLKRPASDFGFETDLWNTTRLRQICSRKLGVEISHVGVWKFLTRYGQSFKKVQKRYYEANTKEQEEWKRTVIPKIKRTVKRHRAILYFEDESNIQLSPVMGRSWGEVGEKITHTVTGNRGGLSAISAISNDGRLLFSIHDGGKRFNSDDIIIFLEQILGHHKRRHLVLIMDKATCHTSKQTKEFIESQKRLHVFFLPPRSPELNPDEQVWGYLQNGILTDHPLES